MLLEQDIPEHDQLAEPYWIHRLTIEGHPIKNKVFGDYVKYGGPKRYVRHPDEIYFDPDEEEYESCRWPQVPVSLSDWFAQTPEWRESRKNLEDKIRATWARKTGRNNVMQRKYRREDQLEIDRLIAIEASLPVGF